MSRNIQRRRSIHELPTPQREVSHQEENNDESTASSASESDEEYYTTIKDTSKGCKPSKVSSCTPQQKNQKPSAAITNNGSALKTALQWKFVVPCLILVIVVCSSYSKGYHQEEQRFCSFENLQNIHTKENDSVWQKLKHGIEAILNKKTNAAVYLLAHRGNHSELIKAIAHHSSKCFGTKLIPMEKDDFVNNQSFSDDYGYAIEKYKNKIKEGDVFLIANLNEIPAKAARALHAICDTHSPMRKQVVIFLELTVEKYNEGNADSIAEATLEDMWGSEIAPNELGPLITRVTEQVIIF